MRNCFLLLLIGAAMLSAQSIWPQGKTAAVCLTYDDAWPSQLDISIPALDKLGFKATFYINGNSEDFAARLDEWRQVAADGHELGNHTLFHPCLEFRGDEHRQWLTDEFKLENYTLHQFLLECRVANLLLRAVDGKTMRSFAYTCCDTWVGDGVSLVEPLSALFPCARGIGPTPTALDEIEIMNTPSFAVVGHSGAQLIEQVQIAERHGTVVVFLFHGIDESHLPVSSAAHRELLDYLARNRRTIWTDTFLNVFNHLKTAKQ